MVKIPTPSGIPRLILFDIEGTLTKPTTMTLQSILRSVSVAFGHVVTDRGLYFPGSTTEKLVKLVLQANGITPHTCKNYDENISRVYEILPQITSDMIITGEYTPEAVPSSIEFVRELSQCNGFKLGLLSGNLESVSRVTLGEAGFELKNFEIGSEDEKDSALLLGGFGSDNPDRSKLIKIAMKKYSRLINKPVLPQDVIVIGNSPRDIKYSHDNGVACVCVTTGSCDITELSESDFIIPNFRNYTACMKALMDPDFVY